MKQYQVTLTGLTPLIMHSDNIASTEKILKWQKDPVNKELSSSGDDRSPAWTWLGYAYHDTKWFGIPADNLMTMMREGGAKVKAKGKETYKKQTQSGLLIDQSQWDLRVNDTAIEVAPIFNTLMGNTDFSEHLDIAEKNGFELLVKRAKVGQAKHMRVRPLFRNWTALGTFTVIDEKQSGLAKKIIEKILQQAGSFVGLCDWRPSSKVSSGSFGKFSSVIKKV